MELNLDMNIMKNMKCKVLLSLSVLSFLNVNAVTSLFEPKDITYEPYDYKKSEFNALPVSKRIDCMLEKLAELQHIAADKKFNINYVAFHQIVKAIHAAHAVEHRLRLSSEQKAKIKRLDVGYSKEKRLQIRLENLEILLTNLKDKKFTTRAQGSALYQLYKYLEKGLYTIDKKNYTKLINTDSVPLFYE